MTKQSAVCLASKPVRILHEKNPTHRIVSTLRTAAGLCRAVHLVWRHSSKNRRALGWIRSKSGDHTIKIQNTAINARGYVRYEGPLEVLDRSERPICKADVELLEQPFMFAEDRYLYFLSGDAVDVRVQAIDLKTCKLSWQSPAYYRDNSPVIVEVDSALYLSKKKVPLKSDCLPTIPSAEK